jgi:hypothetical protein
LGERFTMTSDISRLAAADVGDQGDAKRQIRLLPEIADFTRLAIVGQLEILERKVFRRRPCAIGDRA